MNWKHFFQLWKRMLDLCWKTEIKTKKLLFSSCSKKLSQVLTTWSVLFLTHSLEGFFPPIFFLSLEYRNCLNSSLFKFEYVNCPHSNFSSHSTTGLTHTWKDATSHRKKKKKKQKGTDQALGSLWHGEKRSKMQLWGYLAGNFLAA